MGTAWRVAVWIGLPVVLGLLAMASGLLTEPDAPTIAGLVLAWAFVGGGAEALAWLGRALGPPSVVAPIDQTPADGVVGLAALRGVIVEPNPRDRRIGRIVAVEAESGDTSRRRGRGGARTLAGRVVVVSLFLGRAGEGRGWSDAEVVESQGLLVRAGEWIEREAIRYGVPLRLELSSGYVLGRDGVRRPEAELALEVEVDGLGLVETNETVELVASCSRAIAGLRLGEGLTDLAALIDRLERRIEADQVVWLLLPRASGQSVAIGEDVSGIPGVHLAVCYAREAAFSGPLAGSPYADPVTIVHELLHLFGASDKYGPPLESFPAGMVTTRDVMRLDVERLSQLRIDGLTAREIGWPGSARAQAETPGAIARRTRRASRG